MREQKPVNPGSSNDTKQASEAKGSEKDPNSAKAWKNRIQRIKRKREDLVDAWAISVDYRRGKPFDDESDEDRVYVNQDWSMTRRKAAELASQVPEVRLQAKRDQYKPAMGAFGREINDQIKEAGVGAVMFECTRDVINAAGIGVALASYEARTEVVEVPTIDLSTYPPDQVALLKKTNQIPTMKVPRVADKRFPCTRISPADFLWPLEFTGSDFDKAPYLGYSGRCSWSEAVHLFKLKDEDKDKVVKGAGYTRQNLRDTIDDEKEPEVVEYDAIYYWRHRFDAKEPRFDSIWWIVFAGGKDEPIVHEPWPGQLKTEQGQIVGATKLPIRVLTLEYISDDPIPPSDSAIARPQTNELMSSRTAMILQRKRSVPVRWYDVNRVDPMTSSNLMLGKIQNFIPVQGAGSNAIGEVARASYPPEDFNFDGVIKSDIQESWMISANQNAQMMRSGRTAKEAQLIQQNFSIPSSVERSRVAAFFVGIAEVMAGLIALYGDFEILTPEELQQLDQAWDRRHLANKFVYSVLPDSTVLLDANQKIQRNMQALNMLGKSGFINVEYFVEETLMLMGIDPTKGATKPQPKPPEEVTASLRLTGTEDLRDPLVLAMLIRDGKAPSTQELEVAKQLILAAQQPAMPAAPTGAVPPKPGQPGQPGQPPRPGLPPPPGKKPAPSPNQLKGWDMMPRVNKRTTPGAA